MGDTRAINWRRPVAVELRRARGLMNWSFVDVAFPLPQRIQAWWLQP